MHIGSSATAAEDCSTRAVDDRRATEEDGGAAVDITVAADISVFVTAGNELEQQATSTVVVELLLVVIVWLSISVLDASAAETLVAGTTAASVLRDVTSAVSLDNCVDAPTCQENNNVKR